MNYVRTMISAAVFAGTVATSIAGSPPQWHALLTAAIEASARGECPANLMEEALRAKCVQDQGAVLPELFVKMGKLQAAEFVGVEASRGGAVEIYRVIFERGETIWHIAANTDGNKISGLWATDPLSYTPMAR